MSCSCYIIHPKPTTCLLIHNIHGLAAAVSVLPTQKGTFSPLSSYRVGRRGGKIPSPPPPLFCRGQTSGTECHACSPKRQIAKTQVRQSKRGEKRGGQLFLLVGRFWRDTERRARGNIGPGNPFAAKPSDNRKENLASVFLRAGERESR